MASVSVNARRHVPCVKQYSAMTILWFSTGIHISVFLGRYVGQDSEDFSGE